MILWLFFLLGVRSSEPAAEPVPRTVQVRGADLELLTDVREIAERVEALRGESFSRPPIAVRAPDSMREVAAEIRALNVLHRKRLQARGRAWADLGLGGGDAPEALYRLLAGDLAGVGFDPDGRRLLVAPDRLTGADFEPAAGGESPATVLLMTGVRVDEPLFAHLLIHVRQAERRGGDTLDPTTDRLLAQSAWAEGEANLIAIRYLFDGMGMADAVVNLQISPTDVLQGDLLPRDLEQLDGPVGEFARFVYVEGFHAATRVYRSGGFEALDRAIASRQTTYDLLHPARPPVRATVPEPIHPVDEGLERVDDDTLGAEGIFVLVAHGTGKDNLALLAVDGWAGDRLERWEKVGGDTTGTGVTRWTVRCSDEEAAADLDYAIVRLLEGRFPGRPLLTLEGGERLLVAADRVYRLRRSDTRVGLRIAARELDEPPQGALTGR